MKKFVSLMLAGLLALSLTSALAEFIPEVPAAPYTIEDMIAFAIQDEVNAEAAYQSILNAYGQDLRPFSAIVKAEQTHQALLQPLMDQYAITKPQAQQITVPATFEEALALGVTAEEENIAIYQAFLALGGLPADVQAVFERLMASSGNHLRAFSQACGRSNGAQGRWSTAPQAPEQWQPGNGRMPRQGRRNWVQPAAPGTVKP